MKYTACFTGHRPQTLPFLNNPDSQEYKALYLKIKQHVQALIEKNVNTFLSGMALGVDMLCAEIVLEFKEKRSDLKLYCVLPCLNQDNYWTEKESKRYWSIIDKADKTHYTMTSYTKHSMNIRNKYMVNEADYIIAVWNQGKKGGTWNTIEYALRLTQKTNKQIIFIDTNNL